MSILVTFLAVFNYFPIAYSFIGSFFVWRPLKEQFRFTGLSNYAWMVQDPIFFTALFNTVSFAVVACVLYLGSALWVATMIFSVSRFQSFLRSSYFLPVVTSSVAVSLLWRHAFYNTETGLFNVVLEAFGLPPQLWLLDERQVLACIIVVTVWKELGYGVIILLAGLHEIPTSIYEAAAIDGAGRFKTLRSITIPMLRPAILVVGVTGMIGFLQVFNQIILMTSISGRSPGGPGTSSFTMMLWIYRKAFIDFDFGRASAIGYLLVLVILMFTAIQFRLNRTED